MADRHPVAPQTGDSHFWGTAHAFARASAHDLNIYFRIFYPAQNNRHAYIKAFSDAMGSEERPDAVIGIFYRFVGKTILDMAREAGTPVFMVNTNIPDQEQAAIGRAM